MAGLRRTPLPWLILAAIVVAIVVAKHWPGSSSHAQASDHATAIQTSIGAVSCDNSGYYVQNRLDNTKQTIYDCQMDSGTYKCVTESGSVISDSTAEVSQLFQSTLDGSKPTCVSNQEATQESLRADLGRVQIGEKLADALLLLGKPDTRQHSVSSYAGIRTTDDYLYYGSTQLAFENGKLVSKNS
jgi:hypothetical protein